MRGSDGRSGSLFSYVDLEDRVPKGHPLRVIRRIVDDVLGDMRLSRTWASASTVPGSAAVASGAEVLAAEGSAADAHAQFTVEAGAPSSPLCRIDAQLA